MGSELCQVCWLVKNSEGQRERGLEVRGRDGGREREEGREEEEEGDGGRKRERERETVIMSQTSHTSLPYIIQEL